MMVRKRAWIELAVELARKIVEATHESAMDGSLADRLRTDLSDLKNTGDITRVGAMGRRRTPGTRRIAEDCLLVVVFEEHEDLLDVLANRFCPKKVLLGHKQRERHRRGFRDRNGSPTDRTKQQSTVTKEKPKQRDWTKQQSATDEEAETRTK